MRGLSEILDVSYESVLQKTENRKSYYQIVKRKIEKEIADEVRKFKQEHNLERFQSSPIQKGIIHTEIRFAGNWICWCG